MICHYHLETFPPDFSCRCVNSRTFPVVRKYWQSVSWAMSGNGIMNGSWCVPLWESVAHLVVWSDVLLTLLFTFIRMYRFLLQAYCHDTIFLCEIRSILKPSIDVLTSHDPGHNFISLLSREWCYLHLLCSNVLWIKNTTKALNVMNCIVVSVLYR